MSAYTAAALTEFDPGKPVKWPANPRLVASARQEEQMRPRALAFDRRFAWMATGPVYGKLGGALSRIDPESGEIKTFRNIVPDQTINGIALDMKRRRVYCSSEIYGDMNSCPPTQSKAQVVAFDMEKLEVIKRQEFEAHRVDVACVLADGRVLINWANMWFAWDADREKLVTLGTLAGGGTVVADDRGELWGSIGGSIGRLTASENAISFKPLIPHQGGQLQIEDDTLYYVIETTIYATPLEELRAKL
jgi:hypothetical protein